MDVRLSYDRHFQLVMCQRGEDRAVPGEFAALLMIAAIGLYSLSAKGG